METAVEIEILDKRGGVLFGNVQVESGNKSSRPETIKLFTRGFLLSVILY